MERGRAADEADGEARRTARKGMRPGLAAGVQANADRHRARLRREALERVGVTDVLSYLTLCDPLCVSRN